MLQLQQQQQRLTQLLQLPVCPVQQLWGPLLLLLPALSSGARLL
jgi:hypothetical protein